MSAILTDTPLCVTFISMQFYGTVPSHDLTYSDVFLVPSRSGVSSRLTVDLSSSDNTGATIPIVAANMNAVTGRRLAATLARRGGLAVLPQDLAQGGALQAIEWVKAQPVQFGSAYSVRPGELVSALRKVLPPVAEQGFVVEDEGRFLGVVSAEMVGRALPDAKIGDLVHGEQPVLSSSELSDGEAAFRALEQRGVEFAAVVDDGLVVGSLSRKQAMRSTVYQPALDAQGRLRVAAAVGINGDVAGRARALLEAGVDALVVDTAHGHQEGMLAALEKVRALNPGVPVVAGNTVTAAGVRDLVNAGADIIKVGVGPGAMCTTRMMTAVGRPQFSAVLESAAAATELGASVWADGGVRYPRDVALALAAGAASVMIGSWLAGTIEAPGELVTTAEGRQYKENFGMASTRAVQGRFAELDTLERARKELFSEGISGSRIYLDSERPSLEDLLDQITAGVRSSCTYAGASTLSEFHARALVGIQSAAGYDEGRALAESW